MPRTVTSLNPLTVTVTGTVKLPCPVTVLMSAVARRFSAVMASISSLSPHSRTVNPPSGTTTAAAAAGTVQVPSGGVTT